LTPTHNFSLPESGAFPQEQGSRVRPSVAELNRHADRKSW